MADLFRATLQAAAAATWQCRGETDVAAGSAVDAKVAASKMVVRLASAGESALAAESCTGLVASALDDRVWPGVNSGAGAADLASAASTRTLQTVAEMAAAPAAAAALVGAVAAVVFRITLPPQEPDARHASEHSRRDERFPFQDHAK